MIWACIETSINFFESWLILYFMKSRLQIKGKTLLLDSLCILFCTLYYSINLFCDVKINDILIFVIPFIYALIVASDRWQISLFWTIMLATIFSSTSGAIIHSFFTILSDKQYLLENPSYLRFFFLLISNSILFLVIYSASKIQRQYIYISWPTMFVFLIISLSILILEECLYHLENLFNSFSLLFFIGYLASLFATISSIFLFRLIATSSMKENQYKAEINTYNLTLKHQQEFTQMYNDFSAREHDFKHHLEVLEVLIAQSNSQKASNYLSSYRASLTNSKIFMTGCEAVDALLTAKYLTMKSHNIEFTFSPYPLHALPIPSTDFCSIIGNLLDNAIEGSLRVTSHTSQLNISLTLSRTYDVFYILCQNYCNPDEIHVRNNVWLSSKKSNNFTRTHGIGIANIKKIVDQSSGYCKFSVNGNIFSAELNLPYPIQKQESIHYEPIC